MNIIYIHTHDTGILTSVHGYPTPTPNLLSFAKDATVYRNAYCVSPTCSPSRGSLLTGMYPHNNGLIGLTHRGFELNDHKKHLAYFLKSNGYQTILSGVQHETGFWDSPSSAKELGYEEILTSELMGVDGDGYSKWDKENCRRLCEWIKQWKQEKPIFISYGLFSTHRPYPSTQKSGEYIQVPEGLQDNFLNREDTAGLYQSLENFDDNFGQLIQTLKEKGIYDQSVILVTTDHGLANPLAKCNLNKNGTKVLLMMRYPKNVKDKKVHDELVSQLDIFPTLCDVVGLNKPSYLQGRSLVSDTKTEEIFQEINFHTSYELARAIRTSRFLYVSYLDDQWGKYNLSNCDQSFAKNHWIEAGWQKRNKDQEQLYDLVLDPQEKQNVVNEEMYKETLLYFRNRLRQWREETDDEEINLQYYLSKCKVNKKRTIHPTIQSIEDRQMK